MHVGGVLRFLKRRCIEREACRIDYLKENVVLQQRRPWSGGCMIGKMRHGARNLVT